MIQLCFSAPLVNIWLHVGTINLSTYLFSSLLLKLHPLEHLQRAAAPGVCLQAVKPLVFNLPWKAVASHANLADDLFVQPWLLYSAANVVDLDFEVARVEVRRMGSFSKVWPPQGKPRQKRVRPDPIAAPPSRWTLRPTKWRRATTQAATTPRMTSP